MNVNEELARFQITETDLENVRKIGNHIVHDLQRIMDDFYNNWMKKESYYESYFFDDKVVLHIKNKQIEYWQEFFKANIDEKYIEGRKHLGVVHAQVGLSLTNYFKALAYFQKQFEAMLADKQEINVEMIWSFSKYLNWDTILVSEARATSSNAMLERMLNKQNKEMADMAVPISRLWSDILFLPIVGRVSSKRATELLETVLKSIADYQATSIILDISGLSKLNKKTAKAIVKIIQSSKLMGCNSLLSGISPAMAETFVELDYLIEAIDGRGSLMDAMIAAMETSGHRIIELETEESF